MKQEELRNGDKTRPLYILEGTSRMLLDELWLLYEARPDFPLSVKVFKYVIHLNRRSDLLHFYMGLQVGIEMNMI